MTVVEASRRERSDFRQPNFILIITDQQRADFLSCYGHPLLRTPNIDALASRGTRFNRCYVASPVCMANRASLMTGRMPSVHGVRMNGIPLSQLQATFVEALRSVGYSTSLIGKSHLQNMIDVAPYVHAQSAQTSEAPLTGNVREARRNSGADYDQELPYRWRAQNSLVLQTPYYGFDHVDLCTGHGDLVGGHYFQWLRKQHPDPESLRGPTHGLPHDYVCPQAWRTAVPEQLYPTAYIRDRALEFLSAKHTEPYFLMISFPTRIIRLRRPAAIGISIDLTMSNFLVPSMPRRRELRRRAGRAASAATIPMSFQATAPLPRPSGKLANPLL